MKRIAALLATVAGAGLMSSAYAADLIIEEPVAEVGIVDVGDWNGAYIGVHAGWGWGDVDVTDEAGDLGDFDPYDLSGWLVGVQAGANFQMDSFVLGIEGDIAWSDIGGDSLLIDDNMLTTDVTWLGTIRGRLGFAADAFMFYGTAGIAFAGVDTTLTDFGPTTFTSSSTRTGWVAGIGAEAMVSDSLSIKAEYLYHDFGSEDFSFDGGDETGATSLNVSTVKVGLNWHF
jgi:outer membrane immunogenic protein